MIRTILLDLDDTLLVNKMDQFLPAYFKLLGGYLEQVAPPERMLAELIAGTQAMLANLDPRLTLEQVFASHFYPALGLDQSELADSIETFYKQQFPRLQDQTQPVAGVPGFIRSLLSGGFELVVATNPLFPRLAVEERLRWAGIPPEEMHFTLITSYENSHFAKPNPEYFAEILAKLGRNPGQAIMVGDDLERDILPAAALGMTAYHTLHEQEPGSSTRHNQNDGSLRTDDSMTALDRPDPQPDVEGGAQVISGSLLDLQAVLTPHPAPQDEIRKVPPRMLLARLRSVLAAKLSFLDELDDDLWTRQPDENEWAPVEIIAHLRDVEREVNLPRIEKILSTDEPYLTAYDTDRWASERGYLEQEGTEALEAFCLARMKMIEMLVPLPRDDWERAARHTLLGPTTLHELVKITSDHDWLHMAQLRETLETVSKQSAS
jgi:FMN phosphatase YigB (HAD superfamily)